MAIDIKQIRALIEQEKAQKENKNKDFAKNYTKFFDFWKMDYNDQVVVRLIEDKNATDPDPLVRNPYGFYLEERSHTIYINGKKRMVACIHDPKNGVKCPLCEKSREYYDMQDKVRGKAFYHKINYLLQCIVVSKINFEDNNSDLLVKGLRFNKSLFENCVLPSISDLDVVPTDFEHGRDLKICKTKNGDHANYSTSSFSFKETAVDPTLQLKIKESYFGLSDLKIKPLEISELEKLTAQFDAELNGQSTSNGVSASTSTMSGPKPIIDSNMSESEEDAPFIESLGKSNKSTSEVKSPQSEVKSSSGDDIMARLAARKK